MEEYFNESIYKCFKKQFYFLDSITSVFNACMSNIFGNNPIYVNNKNTYTNFLFGTMDDVFSRYCYDAVWYFCNDNLKMHNLILISGNKFDESIHYFNHDDDFNRFDYACNIDNDSSKNFYERIK
jgi:hypothetical protein